MGPISRKLRAISVSRTARVFVDGGASIGISVMFGLSFLPDGYRFKRPVYRPFKDASRLYQMAVYDGHFTAKLLDGSYAINIGLPSQSSQIELRRKPSICHGFSLSTDKPELVTRSLDPCRRVSPSSPRTYCTDPTA